MDHTTELTDLGWGEHWAAAWAACDPALPLRPARVARTDRGVATLWPQRGIEVRATSTTAAKDVVAGDWVGYDPASERIELIVPRRSAFQRQAARGGQRTQTLAANMDWVLLVEAAHPKLNERRLERALVLAHQSGARPLVVITKVDLIEQRDLLLAASHASAGGAAVAVVSNRTGEGIDDLRRLLGTRTLVAAVGASGAGKSSLVNTLAGGPVQLTGAVRKGDGKGRHTTTAAQLIDLGDVMYLDTPGIRAIAICGDGSGIDAAFPEIAAAANDCKFDDCSHRREPNCAVLEAVEAGRIDPARLDHYQRLIDELTSTGA